MPVSIVTSREDEEALMAVASGLSADATASESGARLPDGRYDWFVTPVATARFLEGARRYALRAHGVGFEVPRSPPVAPQLGRLREIRDAVHALIDGDRRGYERRTRDLLERYAFRLDATGDLRPAADGWDRFIAERLPALVAIGAHADRVRLCANPDCRWAIWDTTKNGTRVWCDSKTCGNKMKVRAFRERKRREGHTPAA